MYTYLEIESEIRKDLEKAGFKNAKIEKPPEGICAYFSIPCFQYASEMKKAPHMVAIDAAKHIRAGGIIKEIKVVGAYVNVYVDKKILAKKVVSDIIKKEEKYGSLNEKGKVIMDVFQPNTHKAFHIGHLRNAILGESIRRILSFSGKKPVAVSYMGDIGAHVAKWIWYYTKFYKGKIPKKDVSKWAGEIYTKATFKVDENKEKYEKEIHEIHLKLEERDPKLTKIWKDTRKLCIDAISVVQKELDVHLDDAIYESEVEMPGKEIVIGCQKKMPKVIKKSEGAVIVDLEKYNLGVFVLLKSNGATLYSTKDIGLADMKNRKFGRYDESLFIVAVEQEHHFRQLFKTLELIGMKNYEKNHHISYGLVKLADAKMSSRLGNIVLYEDVRDKMKENIGDVVAEKNPSLAGKKEVIDIIALGAIKYSMLNHDTVKTITFSWDRAADFEGNSGPYLQYSYARSKSLLRKSGCKKICYFEPLLKLCDEEADLIEKMSEFPVAVSHAASEYSPHIITNYLYSLAKIYSRFYNDVPVLKAEQKTKMFRLSLVAAYCIVMKNGLELLGIKVPEEM